jgi:ankyrin repeat protein
MLTDILPFDLWKFIVFPYFNQDDHRQLLQIQSLQEAIFLDQLGIDISQALQFVIQNNRFDLIEYLIQRGERVGSNEIETAFIYRHIKLAKFLIYKMDESRIWSHRVFEHVCQNGLISELKSMFSKYKPMSLELNEYLEIACQFGHCHLVRYLISSGASPHHNFAVCLRIACQYGHLKIVKILVNEGVDIHGYQGQSLEIASHNGHFEVVEFLVECGAEISSQTIEMATNQGHHKVAEFLNSMKWNKWCIFM